jgi:hypothetical protein
MAVRTLILMRLRSPLLMPPKADMTRSWASFSGSIGPDEDGEGVAELVASEGAASLKSASSSQPTG